MSNDFSYLSTQLITNLRFFAYILWQVRRVLVSWNLCWAHFPSHALKSHLVRRSFAFAEAGQRRIVRIVVEVPIYGLHENINNGY